MLSPLHSGKVPALFYSGLLISTTLLVGGCASTTEKQNELSPTIAESSKSAPQKTKETVSDSSAWTRKNYDPQDPLEGFNRPMYQVNMFLDHYFIGPVATGYKFITPDFMEKGVTNFFTNLKGINVVLNDTLQGKFEQSASDTGRFLTNTTIGLGGLFDVATEFGLESHNEDFGQTLGTWGVGSTYLVLPIVGPTTLRDFAGNVAVDMWVNPRTYVPGAGVLEGINDRANAEGALNFIDEAALDPYVFTRESYQQYRTSLVNDGKVDKAAIDDLDIDAALEGSDSASSRPKNGGNNGKAGNAGTSSSVAPANSQSNQAMGQVEQEFAEADEKMDQLLARKKRRHRR